MNSAAVIFDDVDFAAAAEDCEFGFGFGSDSIFESGSDSGCGSRCVSTFDSGSSIISESTMGSELGLGESITVNDGDVDTRLIRNWRVPGH